LEQEYEREMMDLTRMTVCNVRGLFDYKNSATDTETVKYAYYTGARTNTGTAELDAYRFYASEYAVDIGGGVIPSTTVEVPVEKVRVVSIVLPIGGADTGIGRFPKLGEQVLVGGDSSEYFLMGYLPSRSQPFPMGVNYRGAWSASVSYAKNDVVTHGGTTYIYILGTSGNTSEPGTTTTATVWTLFVSAALNLHDISDAFTISYKQNTWANGTTDPTSYLKFDNSATQWKKAKDNKDYKDNANNPPMIDHIRLHSTGDSMLDAANHQYIKGKRIEIFSNIAEPVCDANTNQRTGRPDMEYPGDLSQLKSGDVHIRAANKIYLRSMKGISLRVGRSSIDIDDKGVTITSRWVRGNMPNGHDASIKITPRDGVTINGKKVTIAGDQGASIGDSNGANLDMGMGMTSMTGRSITLSMKDSMETGLDKIFRGAVAVVDLGSAATALSMADKAQRGTFSDKYALTLIDKFVKMCKKIYKFYKDISKTYDAWKSARDDTKGVSEVKDNQGNITRER
jgi:hypothetical protein